MATNNEITEIWTLDAARILNQREAEWEEGFLKVYKRFLTKQIYLNEAVALAQIKYSDRIYSKPYSKVTVFARIPTALATAFYVWTEISHNGVNWYNFYQEVVTYARLDLVDGETMNLSATYDIEAEYIRIRLDGSNTASTVSVDVILAS